MTRAHSPKFPCGQASVELMTILPLFLVILALSISIFGTQLVNIQSLSAQHATQKTAQIVANGVESIGRSPNGSSLRIFLPPATQSQTARIQNGLVEVQSSSAYGSSRVTQTQISVTDLYDGNWLYFTKDGNGNITITEDAG